VLWHSLNESGDIAVYDIEWPDGNIETDIPTYLLEGVKMTEHDEAAEGETNEIHAAHGISGHRLDSAIDERKYKKKNKKG
jgi:hypothetical protein|tara:strand:+ start:9556 stop:9795 length:240 start_codon:yes stop_codon:yes gene_type:complete